MKGEKPGDEKTEAAAGEHHEDGDKPAEATAKAANHLAQEQRQLAQQTQQAENQKNQKPGEAGKKAMEEAMAKVAEKQKELNEAGVAPAGPPVAKVI